MTEKRFTYVVDNGEDTIYDLSSTGVVLENFMDIEEMLNSLYMENEQLKKGMIEVVDRYIKNVECNPPSSARTYGKIKGALVNIKEDLRSLISDFE